MQRSMIYAPQSKLPADLTTFHPFQLPKNA